MPDHIRQEPKVLVSTENLNEQEWLAYRRQGIGGSDVAAILGISPFRTARDLYDDKLNIASAVDDTGNWVALEMGHLLEPLVAQIFTKKTGLEVFQIKKMFQHPQYPFMLADVDYFVRLPNGEIALLEIKTTNYNAKDHWWKDGEECVPVYYETQGRHYMAVIAGHFPQIGEYTSGQEVGADKVRRTVMGAFLVVAADITVLLALVRLVSLLIHHAAAVRTEQYTRCCP